MRNNNYQIYQGNSLAQILKNKEHIFTNKLFDVQPLVLVQNSSLADWLKIHIAKHTGISIGLELRYPEQIFLQLAEFFIDIKEYPVMYKDLISFALYCILDKELKQKPHAPELEALWSFVSSSETLKPSEKLFEIKSLELATNIAQLFYSYDRLNLAFLQYWRQGSSYFKNNPAHKNLLGDEQWQMFLWQRLQQDGSFLYYGELFDNIITQKLHPSTELPELIIFGSAFLQHRQLAFLQYISQFTKVQHFLLSPCKLSKLEQAPWPMSDWASAYLYMERDIAEIIGEQELAKEPREELPGAGSLLAQIQAAISAGQFATKGSIGISAEELEQDKSLKFYACTGKWREVEILRDKILFLLAENKDLSLTDIGILAPNINDYSAYIEALFAERTGGVNIPFNIIDIESIQDSPFINGFFSLLNLLDSRFTKSDVFNLFENPCFAAASNIDLSTKIFWEELCNKLNIRWGIDAQHKEELSNTFNNSNTWSHGFERLAAGLAFSEDELTDAPFPLYSEKERELSAQLISIVERLSLLRVQLQKYFLANDIVNFIEQQMDSFLACRPSSFDDEQDRNMIKEQLRNFLALTESLKEMEIEVPKLSLNFILKWLENWYTNKLGKRKGRYLLQGISCASLRPFRTIPFKVLYVLGMDEDRFPLEAQQHSFNLAKAFEENFDMSLAEEHRCSFLELILSTSEQLHFFYNARENSKGEELQPSILIRELLDGIENASSIGRKELDLLVEQHPLHNFNKIYFDQQGALFSYNTEAANNARVFFSAKEQRKDWNLNNTDFLVNEPTKIGNEGNKQLNIIQLMQFLNNPIKSYMNQSLGIYLQKDQDNLNPDIEALELNNGNIHPLMSAYIVNHELFQKLASLPELKLWLQARGLLASGLLADSSLQEFFNQREELRRTWLENTSNDSFSAAWYLGLYQQEHKGSQSYLVANIAPSISIEIARAKVLEIYGQLGPFFTNQNGYYITNRYIYGKNSVYNLASSYLQSLILNSLDASKLIQEIVVQKDSCHKILYTKSKSANAIDTSNAQDILSRLLDIYEDNLIRPLAYFPSLAIKFYKNRKNVPWSQLDELYKILGQDWQHNQKEFTGTRVIDKNIYAQQLFANTEPDFKNPKLIEFLQVLEPIYIANNLLK